MVITGNVTLTPIAAVDISTTPSGVNMFSLLFPAAALDDGNVIQYEYWLYATSDTAKKWVSGGFIAVEDTVSNSGIGNQVNIAIPSTSNAYDPELSVQIRVFVGSTIISSIQVTDWSNGCPVYNPPQSPDISSAYIYRGEYSTYLYSDVLYVILNNNTSYDLTKIKFIVSYYYVNESGDNTWIVSAPLAGTDESGHTIITPIVLADDVSTSEILYVAINAVYQYEYESLLYYTVSEISATVQASNHVYNPPTLNPIAHDDYLVYSTGAQTINLSWIAPDSVLFLPYESYTLNVSVNDIPITPVNGISSSATSYPYSIPSQYYAHGSASVTLTFTLTAIYQNGTAEVSNAKSINTFTYASAPTDVTVAWAVHVEGDATKADILFSFKNPISNGQGTAPLKFYYNVYNNGVQVLTGGGPIDYVSGITPYTVYVNDIDASGTTGSVVVYMQTSDTNTPFGLQNGVPSPAASYTIATVPIIQTISYNASTKIISFEVFSSALLSYSGSIIYRTNISSGLSSLTYFTSAGTLTRLTNDVYKYNFSINIGSIPNNPPIEIGITAANTAGIGFAPFLIST